MIATRDERLIRAVISAFTRDNEILVDHVTQLIYWFRGGLTRDDVWAMSPVEREKAIEFINKRFKDAGDIMKKGGQAFL